MRKTDRYLVKARRDEYAIGEEVARQSDKNVGTAFQMRRGALEERIVGWCAARSKS
jgi:hypothetical protein